MYYAALPVVAQVKDPVASFCASTWQGQKLGLTHYVLSRERIGQTSPVIPKSYSSSSHLAGSQLNTSSAKSSIFVFTFVFGSLQQGF